MFSVYVYMLLNVCAYLSKTVLCRKYGLRVKCNTGRLRTGMFVSEYVVFCQASTTRALNNLNECLQVFTFTPWFNAVNSSDF